MTVFQQVEAYVVPGGLACAVCRAYMHVNVSSDMEATHARCLSRHCSQYGLLAVIKNERISVLASREEEDSRVVDAPPVLDVTPEKIP